MAILLSPIGQRLEIVSSNLARKGRPRGIESTCERFTRVLIEGVDELKGLRDQGKLKRLVKSNEHPQQIEDIFRRIDEATKNFELELTLAIAREVDGITQHAEILRLHGLRPTREARWADVKSEGCVKGTRKSIIDDLMAWCMDDSPECLPVYWLSGMAGTGKTTIAYTICEKLHDHGDASRRLGASFFCSRQLEGARLRQNVIPTIAHDLAHSFPDFGCALLASKFDVQPPPLKNHIQSLLSDPWRSVAANSSLPPLVVVIDALDELEGRDGSLFLEALIREIARHKDGFRGLKFFVTSRQDPRIVDICAFLDSRAVCRLQEVPSDIIEDDIHLYLCTALPALDPFLLLILANQASGLFIYAATVVRFINPPSQLERSSPRKQEERLNILLNAWPNSSQRGVDGLLVDHLYEGILCGWLSPKAEVDRLIAISVLQTILCVEEPILIRDLPGFIEELDTEEAMNLILSLHAVLYISEDRAYSYHKSFLDFVFDSTRFSDNELATTICPSTERQACLATSCFRIMHSLRFNICELPSSSLKDSEVENLDERMAHNIPSVLRYACTHWAKHMSKTPSDNEDRYGVVLMYRDWMEQRLLFWMEVMNLLKLTGECRPSLVTARKWLGTNITHEERDDLTAAENLVVTFLGTDLVFSTPHFYISAFSSCTRESTLFSKWRQKFPRIPNVRANLNIDLLPVCYSPCGTRIAAGADIGVLIWDVSTGATEYLALQKVASQAWGRPVCFSPDGKCIASSSEDNTVRIWNVSTKNESYRLVGHSDRVDAVCFSLDGKWVASGSRDKTVRVWDTSNGNEQCRLDGHENALFSVCFSPDGKHIASGSRDSTVRIWDASNGNELLRIEGHDDWVLSVCFSPDGDYVASGSRDNTVRIWDASTGNEQHRLTGHHQLVNWVCFSPDGAKIASGSNDNTVCIWDASCGRELHRLTGRTIVSSVCFSPDGKYIVSGSEEKIIAIWDISTVRWRQPDAHRGIVNSVCFSPNGEHIVSASNDSVCIWDTKTGHQWHRLDDTEVSSVYFSPDGTRLVSNSPKTSTHWNTSTWELLDRRNNIELEDCPTGKLRIYLSSLGFTQAGATNRHKYTSTNTWSNLDNYDASAKSASVSPNGTHVVVGTTYGALCIWDTATEKELTLLMAHGDAVNSVCFSPDGTQIASGSADKTVRIWDAPGSQKCQCHRENTGNRVGFLPHEVRKDLCPPSHSRAATWCFLESGTKRRTDWRIDSDGWVKSSDGER